MASSGLDSDKFVKQFYIPDHIFLPYSMPECPLVIPECPVLVFVNSKSSQHFIEQKPGEVSIPFALFCVIIWIPNSLYLDKNVTVESYRSSVIDIE